jgi:CBS domain containing-hemolysin-like protein
MESILVKEMMIPLEDYATVSEDATLYEAVRALEETQQTFSARHLPASGRAGL